MTPTLPTPALLPRTLSMAQFQTLAEVPPEIEWFANLTNTNTRRAYEQDINDFMAFAGLRQPTEFRNMGFVRDTCNGVSQQESSRKVRLLGQPIGAILGL